MWTRTQTERANRGFIDRKEQIQIMAGKSQFFEGLECVMRMITELSFIAGSQDHGQ